MVSPIFLKFAALTVLGPTRPSKSVLLSKIIVEYASILSQKLGFIYKFVNSTDGELGRLLPNGSWTGVVGMLHRGEADACLYLSLSEERFKVMEYTYPFSISPVTFLTRKPKHAHDAATFLKPFSMEVWIGICLSFVFMVFLLDMLLLKKHPLINLIMHVYAIVAGQSFRIGLRRISDFYLVSGLVIGATILAFSYNAVLLSFLTVPPLSGVRTIPELARAVSEGNYYCTSFPGGYVARILINSDNVNLQIIGESINKSKGVRSVEDISFHSKTPKTAAFVHGRQLFPHLIWENFASEDSFFLVQMGIAMRKDFHFKAQFDDTIRRLWHSGINKKIEDTAAFESRNLFSDSPESDDDIKTLTLKDFKGIFYFLIAGHTLSVFILILEMAIKLLSRNSFKFPEFI